MGTMMRFLRSHITHHDAKKAERDDFFNFAKTVRHGFPQKAKCIAYDPLLEIMAIGTETGSLRIYGKPGVEFSAEQPDGVAIQKLFFIPNQGRLLSLCADQSFHLWEVNDGRLDHVGCAPTDDRIRTISSCVLQSLNMDTTEGDEPSATNRYRLIIGTETGNLYGLDTKTLDLTDILIYEDVVVQAVPERFKGAPGAVDALAVNPCNASLVVIGYARGLIVYWNLAENAPLQVYISDRQLQSLCFLPSTDGRECHRVISSHSDGALIKWSLSADQSAADEAPHIPFGPFPCNAIHKILWKLTKHGDGEMTIFSGGMPRASFGDRFTVSAARTDKQLVFDLSSEVLDFFTIDDADGEPQSLVLLCEEELVCVDLLDADWRQIRLPYLLPLHASPVTACQYAANVHADVWHALQHLDSAARGQHSSADWPIRGGRIELEEGVEPRRDVLVTGHEDGTVKFWTGASTAMSLLCVLNTAQLFEGYQDPADIQEEEETWPPFRKIGQYDPFTDDPRLGVQRVLLDGESGLLVVGGSAGQTTVWDLGVDEETPPFDISNESFPIVELPVVSEKENFVWKGQKRLQLRSDSNTVYRSPGGVGFSLRSVVQLRPPASITALAVHAPLKLIAVGSAHGFALADVGSRLKPRCVLARCLLNADEMQPGGMDAGALSGAVSRFKSFKKSVRDSFRRRRRRGAGSPTKLTPTPPPLREEAEGEAARAESVPGSASPRSAGGSAKTSPMKRHSPRKSPEKATPPPPPINDDEGVKPVERAIEARSDQNKADVLPSLVRSLHFARTFLINAQTTSDTLWVGTNGGAVQIYVVTEVKSADTLSEQPAMTSSDVGVDAEIVRAEATTDKECQLAKEIHLRHAAPILNILVVDGNDCPVEVKPESCSSVGHRVMISSEEQLKSFSLPSLKPAKYKYKLTSVEGSRLRKIQYARLHSGHDAVKSEAFLITVTNQGELQTFLVKNFRRYMKADCIKPEDVHGILSTVLTPGGEGVYLAARGCEWQRFAVSIHSPFAVVPNGRLCLPEGARCQATPAATDNDADGQTATGSGDHNTDGRGGGLASPTQSEVVGTSPGVNTSAGSQQLNSSALTADLTMDSIRDYTAATPTDSGPVHLVNGGTKTTVVVTSDQGEVAVVEKRTEQITENGNASSGEEDEIAKIKAKNATETTTDGETIDQ